MASPQASPEAGNGLFSRSSRALLVLAALVAVPYAVPGLGRLRLLTPLPDLINDDKRVSVRLQYVPDTPEDYEQFIRARETVRFRKWERRKAKEKKPRATSSVTYESSGDEQLDQRLFDALKLKRLELARTQNLPPYVIFHDKTLREMAIRRPASVQ